MAYHFVQFHMPGCGRYRKFVKVVKDNFDTVSLRAEEKETHPVRRGAIQTVPAVQIFADM